MGLSDGVGRRRRRMTVNKNQLIRRGSKNQNSMAWNVVTLWMMILVLCMNQMDAFVIISHRHYPFHDGYKYNTYYERSGIMTVTAATTTTTTSILETEEDKIGMSHHSEDGRMMGGLLGLSVRRASEIVSVTSQAAWPLLLSLFITEPNNDDEVVWTEEKCRNVVLALEQLGPTFVKFGQALSSRPDILPPTLAHALSSLCDDMTPCFDTSTAKSILQSELLQSSSNTTTSKDCLALLESLSEEPVAAASVGQVYKAKLANGQDVAVKIQRPNIRHMVDADTQLLQLLAQVVDSSNLIQTNLTSAVQEFMSRIWEELDYINEANNAIIFANLYSHVNGTMIHRLQLPQNKKKNNIKKHLFFFNHKKPTTTAAAAGVIVPQIYTHLCTSNILVMEWIDGSKLTSTATTTTTPTTTTTTTDREEEEKRENLELIQQALYVTLCQLLDTGVMHADPHGGNLLKTKDTKQLAYLDFGLLATIPETVRDALVCAVVQMVFQKDVEAVASLFAELDLIPPHIISDPNERLALTQALQDILDNVLDYSPTTTTTNSSNSNTVIPKLKFDQLLDGLTRLIPRFQFQLPPYFVNNARALGTLEGIAKSLDPQFNALQLMYPYSLQRLLTNPSQSPIIDQTLRSLFYDDQNVLRMDKVRAVVNDSALLTGYTKRQILHDIYQTKGGKQLLYQMAKDSIRQTFSSRRRRQQQQHNNNHLKQQQQQRKERNRYDFFKL